ncbi:hypothetical protein MFLAVUS_008517 [Mucor flavus]|uniref:Uncharacterized protein n=1 Tax=Mucor flavus TaxID=439312 RepID=A0ABP9Z7C6_9FUNG
MHYYNYFIIITFNTSPTTICRRKSSSANLLATSFEMFCRHHYGGLVVLKSTLCPIQENVSTVSLPETEEFSVESAPVESAPVVRLIYYNFHPYKFCGDIELVLEELHFGKGH